MKYEEIRLGPGRSLFRPVDDDYEEHDDTRIKSGRIEDVIDAALRGEQPIEMMPHEVDEGEIWMTAGGTSDSTSWLGKLIARTRKRRRGSR